ncbi:MAG TPA: glycosyltransferase, partial [Candidatus Aenigmarchaeota archaeon]|nr:glycosyltransferase [Candidatus Aenigmarchaeota archaeon]
MKSACYKSVSIIIPTLNEKDNIKPLFLELKRYIRSKWNVIIVDSNSMDGTREEAQKVGILMGIPVKVINTGKLDLGNSVVKGFGYAKGKILVVMDADLQHHPKFLQQLVNGIEKLNFDIVIASRFVRGSVVEFSAIRKIKSIGLRYIIYLLFPKLFRIKDPAAGFFALKRGVIKGIALKPIGFKILLEILIKGRYKRVLEIPFVFK